jgi:hypothetical protein
MVSPVNLSLLQRKIHHRCFQLTSTWIPLGRLGSQIHALADKAYWGETNSIWHRESRGSSHGKGEGCAIEDG